MSTVDTVNTETGSNPTVDPGKFPDGRDRIPLGIPQRRLETPGIPGYYLRWFKGTPQRLAQAAQAGFEFVGYDEVETHDVSLGGDASKDGNTDLGSRVSVAEGSESDLGGNAVRMYLMKQKWEWRQYDVKAGGKQSEQVVDALTSAFVQGKVGGRERSETEADAKQRYVKQGTQVPELFRRKTR